jgi:membrane protein insertion efficiency factor YidD
VRHWCRTLLACRLPLLDLALPRTSLPSEPTCSGYARAAVSRYGVLCGCKLVICRLMKCYPFLILEEWIL